MSENQLIDALRLAIDEALTNVHTATIAKVSAVNATTINVMPVTNRVVNGRSIQLPEFIDVPPLFMQGGGSYTAHPIAVGDYCLLILTERCFDRWYEGQDFVNPAEFRMHDYSDGIAIVGVNPLASALTIPSVIQQTGDTNQDGDYTHQGDRVQTGNYTLTGDVSQIGNYSQWGDMTRAGVVTNIGAVNVTGILTATGFTANGAAGVSGSFTSKDNKLITVNNGIIVGIV